MAIYALKMGGVNSFTMAQLSCRVVLRLAAHNTGDLHRESSEYCSSLSPQFLPSLPPVGFMPIILILILMDTSVVFGPY